MIFAAPLGIAVLLYAGTGSWFSFGTVNHGTLIDPPRAVPPEEVALVGGGRVPATFLTRKWTLLHHAEGDCGSACLAVLRSMRQAHRALGRDRGRVQRLLLLASESPPPPEESGVADLTAARSTSAWRRTLEEPGGTGASSGIWLVDPRGFVMLYFAPESGPRAIKDDLKRLLKYSKWQTG